MRKTTILWTLSLALVALSFTSAPASADFHGVCTGFATAYANVGLEAQSDPYGDPTLSYSGSVHCPDAQVTITSLQLFDISGAEPVLLDETEGETCLSLLGESCELAGSVVAGSGQYEVRMLFDAEDPDTAETEFVDVPRHAAFEYLGLAQPVATCTSVGFFPVYAPPGC